MELSVPEQTRPMDIATRTPWVSDLPKSDLPKSEGLVRRDAMDTFYRMPDILLPSSVDASFMVMCRCSLLLL